ncbi:hypothetical protein E2C01_045736 [Portunus trituberculatus]|uniref:Uncharacterized protein n=1 Tax=Portunus trituberculatus TaxID=210409 RepID=A0A5B7G2U4_PORTR|nr:hypothetical protein [Portunus trituberculatus]
MAKTVLYIGSKKCLNYYPDTTTPFATNAAFQIHTPYLHHNTLITCSYILPRLILPLLPPPPPSSLLLFLTLRDNEGGCDSSATRVLRGAGGHRAGTHTARFVRERCVSRTAVDT